jgi:acetyltransferase
MLAAFSARSARLPDGRAVLVRAARPADAPAVQTFVRWLSPLARRRRFLGAVSELSPAQLDRLTRVQDPRDLSLVALAGGAEGGPIVAMAQYVRDDPASAEFALVVADAWQGQGLGMRLLERLLAHAGEAGVRKMSGFVLADNVPMRALAARFGFDSAQDGDPELVRVERRLAPPPPPNRFAERVRRLVASLCALPAITLGARG